MILHVLGSAVILVNTTQVDAESTVVILRTTAVMLRNTKGTTNRL